MPERRRSALSKGVKSRIIILTIVFVLLAAVLLSRLFYLQIVQGETYLNDFSLSIRKQRVLNSTRGEIYDRNGKLLAYNQLAYTVTFEDNGSYETTRERNLTLNGILYRTIKIIESHGDAVLDDFHIRLGESGQFEYDCTGFTLSRFKADLFGKPYIDAPSADLEDQALTEEEKGIPAPELMELLCSEEYYGILDPQVSSREKEQHGLPAEFSTHEVLQLAYFRSSLAANSYQRYNSITIARNVCTQTVSQLKENAADLPGVDITEDYLRVYNDAEYFAPIIGYTGPVSAEELSTLQERDPSYTSDDIVGKVGMEQVMEASLHGEKGQETIYVDNLGRTLSVESRVEPQAGNSLYLTLDSDLQRVYYHLLEQYIAGIVYSNIADVSTIEEDYIQSSDDVYIPVYDVYYALFENNVLDVNHLSSPDASPNERFVYEEFQAKAQAIFAELRTQLTTSAPTAYRDLTDEMKAYQSYIVNTMLVETGILNREAIDESDLTWIAWSQEERISLQEFLTYAISQNWIDINGISPDATYLSSDEIYLQLSDYVADYLSTDTNFCKRVFRYMLQEGSLSGTHVCLLLFDQGVLEMNVSDYDGLSDGSISAYDFICSKIYNLEIKPSQLALNPCSGAIVVTDPDNGDVLACVTYPSYDNNRLVNDMDEDYYYKLSIDLSSPFYSRATQEVLAPGSTFKLVTATAGVMEGQISTGESIFCTGIFDDIGEPIRCWIYSAMAGYGHGGETLATAITDSCNYYFNTVGYRLAMVNGTYEDSTGVEILAKYAQMYGFDSTSGVEVPESSPHIATGDPMRMAMGQSDSAYTVTQLAKYVNTIANSGYCYDLTLIDRVTDSNGNTIDKNEPTLHSTVDLPADLWATIHAGMRGVAQQNAALRDFTTVTMAGKTGTAQEVVTKPNHGAFIGYAPYEDPQMAVAVRVANGYSSTNAAAIARDAVTYYFDRTSEATLVTGHATPVTAGNTSND